MRKHLLTAVAAAALSASSIGASFAQQPDYPNNQYQRGDGQTRQNGGVDQHRNPDQTIVQPGPSQTPSAQGGGNRGATNGTAPKNQRGGNEADARTGTGQSGVGGAYTDRGTGQSNSGAPYNNNGQFEDRRPSGDLQAGDHRGPSDRNGRERQYGDRTDQFRNGAYEVNGQRYERMRGPEWRAPRGYHQRELRRGDSLPRDYRRVVIRDYRSYHLAPPPRGYQYVRVNNDIVLTAVTTGIIAAIVANAFYN